ncbi:VWA domain-containing protein [Candidatus Woesearchaeota archaeon]|nr:VWA domain-containing protein [Candidatus Woesearchaeota archaeon]
MASSFVVDAIRAANEAVSNMIPLKRPALLLLIIPAFFVLLFVIRKNFIKFSSREERLAYLQDNRALRFFIFLTRFLIVSLLIITIATPFVVKEKEVQGELSITLLSDSSNSMKLFEQGLGEKLQKQLESHIPTKLVEIASGDVSSLGDAILASLDRDASVLLISDGNNNVGKDLGDVLVLASQLNTTINAITLEPLYGDTAVFVEGPSTSIVGSDVTLTAFVEQAGIPQEYDLTIEIDGIPVLQESSSGIDRFDVTTTLSEGYHQVVATISGNDYFEENNVFFKTIHIIPKPHIAFVSLQPSPLISELSKLYEITAVDSLPLSLSDYTAVALNNLPAAFFSSEDTIRLTDFVVDAGGLFVIGGKEAYDLGGYPNSLFETLLPAKSGQGEKLPDDKAALVLVIDISGSTGGSVSGLGGASKVDMEKALAIRILEEDVKPNDLVGVVAFNSEAFVISPLSSLDAKKADVIDMISRLQDGGGTQIDKGIKAAEELLRNVEGSKNIILVSDGVTMNEDDAISRIYGATIGGIKTYTVGVGDNTDKDFMIGAAQRGGGIYFQPETSQHLKLIFGEPEDDPMKKDLIIIDENHFITRGLTLEGALTGYNQVVPKASASNLITTGNGNPVLVTWRFGLGRVASLATDDGNAWGSTLISSQNSKLFSRIVNWVIGDPAKDKSKTVLAEDGFLGEPLEVFFRSSSQPTSSQIEFSKIDKDLYRGVFTPAQVGFSSVLDATVAVNYKKEYMHVGVNPKLSTLVRLTGGEMFDKDDINGIVERVQSAAKRKETREIPFQWPFLAAALILFLFDIFVRKLAEHRR